MINRVAEFERVSLQSFAKDIVEHKINMTTSEIAAAYNNIMLPKRATEGSAGYDFMTPYPFNLSLDSKNPSTIVTGIKCNIDVGWTLLFFPKSGLSKECGTKILDTVPIIDLDYYNNTNNEGNIIIQIYGLKDHEFKRRDKFIQAMFIPFGITRSDNVTTKRTGGFGSTGR